MASICEAKACLSRCSDPPFGFGILSRLNSAETVAEIASGDRSDPVSGFFADVYGSYPDDVVEEPLPNARTCFTSQGRDTVADIVLDRKRFLLFN